MPYCIFCDGMGKTWGGDTCKICHGSGKVDELPKKAIALVNGRCGRCSKSPCECATRFKRTYPPYDEEGYELDENGNRKNHAE